MRDECAELISRNYPVLRISLPYCDRAHESKLQALYGLLATIEESLYRASDPVVSNAKLTWWFEELQQARRGDGNHPIALQLQSSGVFAAWPEDLIERLFSLAIRRTDPPGITDEHSLLEFCESMGMIQLQLESALQNGSVPDRKMIRLSASINGLMQLFRESFKARHATYYWVPLVECARLGAERQKIVEDPSDIKSREVFIGIIDGVLDHQDNALNFPPWQELPRAWATSNRHWLVFSLLQQRQLLRLRRDLAQQGHSGDNAALLRRIRLSDGWYAWRAARRLNAVGTG